jgi:hypothetical protein
MQDLPPMINPASLPRQAMCSGLSRLRTCFKSLALILSDRKPEVPLRAKRFAKRTRWKRATGESPRSGRLEGCAARLLRRPRPSRRPCRPPQGEGLGSVYASKQDLSALRYPAPDIRRTPITAMGTSGGRWKRNAFAGKISEQLACAQTGSSAV